MSGPARGLFARFVPGPDDLLREPAYRRLWTSILLSSLGGQVTLLALPLTAAVLLHATPTQMGTLTAMELSPFVLLGLPAGVWLDRRRKLPVYVWGERAMAATLATVPLAWWLGLLRIEWLYLIGFVIGTVHAVAGTAAQVVLTQLVPRSRLVEAHAKNALASSTAEVVGPGLAGVFIKLVGAPIALLADATMLLASSLILRRLPVEESVAPAGGSFLGALKDGLDFVRRQPVLVATGAAVGLWQFANQGATVVHLLFATRTLGLTAREIGLCYVASGAGTIVASGLAPRLARRIGSARTMMTGIALCGVGWLLLAGAPATALGVAAYATMLFLFGAGAVFLFVTFLALRQSVTPPALLGRMTTIMRWTTLVPSVPGALWAGWLGEHVSLRAALVSSGGLALAVALAGIAARALRGSAAVPRFEAEAVRPYSAPDDRKDA